MKRSSHRAKRAPVPLELRISPKERISFTLEYFIGYKAGIRVVFSGGELKCHADYRISPQRIDAFIDANADLFNSWHEKIAAKNIIKLPEGSKTTPFKRKFTERCIKLLEERGYNGPSPEKIVICNSKSYWGRCSADKVISISSYCYSLSDDDLYYILMHEHAHLTHMHHKPEFWNLVELYCPYRKEAQSSLKRFSLEE